MQRTVKPFGKVHGPDRPGDDQEISLASPDTPPRPDQQEAKNQHRRADPEPDQRQQSDHARIKSGHDGKHVLRPLMPVAKRTEGDAQRRHKEQR